LLLSTLWAGDINQLLHGMPAVGAVQQVCHAAGAMLSSKCGQHHFDS